MGHPRRFGLQGRIHDAGDLVDWIRGLPSAPRSDPAVGCRTPQSTAGVSAAPPRKSDTTSPHPTITQTESHASLSWREGEEVRKGDVYSAIKRLVTDSDSASVRLLMTRLERLSALYGRVSGVADEPHPELALYLDHFRRLDFGSVYPLLLALYEGCSEGQFALGEFVACLGILHSFILRRMVVVVPSNSLSGLFISICKTKPVTETPSAWLSSSLGREDKNRRCPTDAEFADNWVRSTLYDGRYSYALPDSSPLCEHPVRPGLL